MISNASIAGLVFYLLIGGLVGRSYYELSTSTSPGDWGDVLVSAGAGICWPILAVIVAITLLME